MSVNMKINRHIRTNIQPERAREAGREMRQALIEVQQSPLVPFYLSRAATQMSLKIAAVFIP